MTYYFTADPHFGHEKIIDYCNRPFSSIEEMDQELIRQWNLIVGDDDETYILGDLTLGKDASKYLLPLKGRIHIVPGGHDWRWGQNQSIIYWGGRIDILSGLHVLEIPQKDSKYPLIISLCHFAQRAWDRSHYGSLSFHGHSHGMLPIWPNTLDVGVDNAYKLLGDYRPFSLDEAVALARSFQ